MEIKISNYGQLRELNCAEEEMIMFETLRNVTGCEELELVRRSDNYVTACIGQTDVARMKFTPRAKWILFPYIGNVKHLISEPSQVEAFTEEAKLAVLEAKRIESY